MKTRVWLPTAVVNFCLLNIWFLHKHHAATTDNVFVATTNAAADSGVSLPRVLAVYFPQYHQDPLNDKLWGANFTDWDSLRHSPKKNRFGYPIPRPSSEEPYLGYYDLTNTTVRRIQGQLAKENGIDGFIIHHYWFYDKTHPGPNLHAPLERLLEDGQPDLPFFFNWCAVKWVNVWMGRPIFQKPDQPINMNNALTLQEQFFDPTLEEIQQHYAWLSRFFHHPNYMRIQNQPILLVYQVQKTQPILETLRELARQDGFDGIHLILGRSDVPQHIYNTSHLDERLVRMMKKRAQPIESFGRDAYDLFNQTMTYPYMLGYINRHFFVPEWCYNKALTRLPADTDVDHPESIGVVTTFDNTPRRDYRTASVYNAGDRELVLKRFYTNLYAAIYFQTCCLRREKVWHENDRFVVVNAWNEWAEGMSIEPSDVYGKGFLQVIRDVKQLVVSQGCQGRPSDLSFDDPLASQAGDKTATAEASMKHMHQR